MIKKLVWFMALSLTCCGGAEGDGAEIEQVSQPQSKGGGSGSYSCSVEQCNGLVNPFGRCTHSINGTCIECTAGTHVGSCSGSGPCAETNCPPVNAHP